MGLKKLLTLQGWKDLAKALQDKEPEAYFKATGGYRNYFTFSNYNGESNLGGIGPVKNYLLDYEALRARGWEAYLTNETVQAIINKSIVWVIGCGLRLQAAPDFEVLNSEGINLTKEEAQKHSELIEARFRIFKESKRSSFSGMMNLSQAEATCYKNKDNGGDVLVVLRYVDGWVKFELIDGCHVCSPMGGDDWNPQILESGNRIMNGVEMNERGEHVAYWVQDSVLRFKRIAATNRTTGLKVAYLVGGLAYRLDNSRCAPVLSGLLETLAGMDRYKKATLETAEEQNKIVFQAVRPVDGVDENVLQKQAQQARNVGVNTLGKVPIDSQMEAVADKVAVSTNKETFNMPPGSELKPLQKNSSELYFKDFYSVFFDLVCSARNIPPNVAMSKYDTSFSSARAAIKDWEHTLIVDRYNFSLAFLQPIYEFWLHIQVRLNKINLPGYLTAFNQNNEMVIASYTRARWVGDNVPHIDPLKEVMAERLKLGSTGETIPLTTVEAATEALNGGDSKSNIEQYSKEKKESEAKGIKIEPPKVTAPTGSTYKDLVNYALNLDIDN